ncbi:WXG100 family type VII secretion target [Gordonia sp. VNK21]|uniref:WXG100 family type VII secretion target n=1 Tax=Gordonia sp. VNK21 TaxID=3382483 RepID=UPI0038D40552
MNGVIRYDFDGLGALSGDLKAQFSRLEELAGSLRRQVTALAANWESGGAAAYQEAQDHWDKLFFDARTRLDGLGTGVAKASNRMFETDHQVGRTFGV